ncbi:hypothetical protein WJX73_000476 [Symbiochloris irregularis]|uniref:Uncharacterized protein n=1 Tax=Symbiochloris irregularis TaxID=706552 RepID=A0AAW1P320_9CHLO
MAALRGLWRQIAPATGMAYSMLPTKQSLVEPSRPAPGSHPHFMHEYDTTDAFNASLSRRSLQTHEFRSFPEFNSGDTYLVPRHIPSADLQIGDKQDLAEVSGQEHKCSTTWQGNLLHRHANFTASSGFGRYYSHYSIVFDLSKLRDRQHLPPYIVATQPDVMRLFGGGRDTKVTFKDAPSGQHRTLDPAALCFTTDQAVDRLLLLHEEHKTTWWQCIRLSPCHAIELELNLRMMRHCTPHGIVLKGGPDRSAIDALVSVPSALGTEYTWQNKACSQTVPGPGRLLLGIDLRNHGLVNSLNYSIGSFAVGGGMVRVDNLDSEGFDPDVRMLLERTVWGMPAQALHELGVHREGGATFYFPIDLKSDTARVDRFWERFTQDLSAPTEEVLAWFRGVCERGAEWNRMAEEKLRDGYSAEDLSQFYNDIDRLKDPIVFDQLNGDTADAATKMVYALSAKGVHYCTARKKRMTFSFAQGWDKKYPGHNRYPWSFLCRRRPNTFLEPHIYTDEYRAMQDSSWDPRQPIHAAVEELQLHPRTLAGVYERQRWILAGACQAGANNVTFQNKPWGGLHEDGMYYPKGGGDPVSSAVDIDKLVNGSSSKNSARRLKIGGHSPKAIRTIYNNLPAAAKELPPLPPTAQAIMDDAAALVDEAEVSEEQDEQPWRNPDKRAAETEPDVDADVDVDEEGVAVDARAGSVSRAPPRSAAGRALEESLAPPSAAHAPSGSLAPPSATHAASGSAAATYPPASRLQERVGSLDSAEIDNEMAIIGTQFPCSSSSPVGAQPSVSDSAATPATATPSTAGAGAVGGLMPHPLPTEGHVASVPPEPTALPSAQPGTSGSHVAPRAASMATSGAAQVAPVPKANKRRRAPTGKPVRTMHDYFNSKPQEEQVEPLPMGAPPSSPARARQPVRSPASPEDVLTSQIEGLSPFKPASGGPNNSEAPKKSHTARKLNL